MNVNRWEGGGNDTDESEGERRRHCDKYENTKKKRKKEKTEKRELITNTKVEE